jgi:hypothetical protein
MKADEDKLRKRADIFEYLNDVTAWLANRAASRDVKMFDLESARVKIYARLVGGERPNIPSVSDDFGGRRTVLSVDDMTILGESMVEELEYLLDNPEEYGVTLVDALDEESILLRKED